LLLQGHFNSARIVLPADDGFGKASASTDTNIPATLKRFFGFKISLGRKGATSVA
jgi:hypothetical protein